MIMRWIKGVLDKLKVNLEEPQAARASPSLETVNLKDLSSWLELKEYEFLIKTYLQTDLENYILKLKDLRFLLDSKLAEWMRKNQSIKGRKADEAAALFRKTKEILELLHLPEKTSLSEALQLNQHLEFKTEHLIKKVGDCSFAWDFSFILSEEEQNSEYKTLTNPLLQELVKLKTLQEDFNQKVEQSSWKMINKLHQTADYLEHSSLKIAQYKEQLNKLSERLKEAEERKETKQVELDKIKLGASYLPPGERENKQSELLSKISQSEEKIAQFFQKLKPALKQYYFMDPSDEQLLQYFEKPVDSFLRDKEQRMIHLLQRLSESIEKGELKLNSEQKKEALLLLLQVPSLKEWRKENLILRKERHQLELQAMDKALNMKLDDAQYRLEHFIQQTEHLRQEVSFLEDQIGEQMTFQQRLVEEFNKSALEILGKEIEVLI